MWKFTVLIFLSLYGIVISNPDRAVDCRKFVFAPLCRGVAAKRGNLGNGHGDPTIYINAKTLRELMKNFFMEAGHPEGSLDLEDAPISAKYHSPESKNFVKLLSQSNTVSSESDNVPINEYDN